MAANGRVYILDPGKQPHKEEAGNCVGVRDIRDFVYLTYALRLYLVDNWKSLGVFNQEDDITRFAFSKITGIINKIHGYVTRNRR